MTKKAKVLESALLNLQAKKSTPALKQDVDYYVAPSRVGKVGIAAYLSPDFKASLRLIQVRQDVSLQALIAEALNDLFVKYNVPTVQDD